MSKLTTHQIRAMIGKIEATIRSHEARPGSESNIRKLEASERKLEAYATTTKASHAHRTATASHSRKCPRSAAPPQAASATRSTRNCSRPSAA